MKIFSAVQIRQWDRYTVDNEPIPSIGLMERAALVCTQFIKEHIHGNSFMIFAGTGNNGGDGFAIARLLKQQGKDITIYQLVSGAVSEDCRSNFERLQSSGIECKLIRQQEDLPAFPGKETWIIDAVLGTGQNRPLEGIHKEWVDLVNSWQTQVIAIDLPTGLAADEPSGSASVVQASYTLSFQSPKLCFFMPENEDFLGDWSVLDIGLSAKYYAQTETRIELTEMGDIQRLLIPRKKFSHKGTHGTALLLCGSKGMMGAALLASGACLRSGVGKLVCRVPACGLDLLQGAHPEAICSPDDNQAILEHLPDNLGDFQAIGAGPGLGKSPETSKMISQLLEEKRVPLVLDADALNIIAMQGWQDRIPEGTIITPHIREFERLFGRFDHHQARIEAALEIAARFGIYIILKGRYSFLATPSGKGYFNPTGNAGMAKAGTGDVLTGMVTGILAQGYHPEAASKLSVYLHGMAGDLARSEYSEYGITASDLIQKIGFCYLNFFSI